MLEQRERQEFAERRAIKLDAGSLYRALKNCDGLDVDVTVVDPRAILVYLGMVLSHGARYGVPWRERWRAALAGASIASVIADGRVVSVGRIPSVDEVVAALRNTEEADLHRAGLQTGGGI